MNKRVELVLPISGEILPITDVNDYLFNKRIIGDGVAINPKGNFIFSPIDGEIILVYDAKHAIGIKTEHGLEILIHVGIDSVKLEGKGFATYVKVGDKVKKGDKILFFDKEFLEEKVSPITPIVITNPELVDTFSINYKAAKIGETFLIITLR